ncbi:EPIDERMAL PATTERNING FACTOR-like protein 3 [Phragmites australis]|uniref:EPIDERMAL PATTERNING FACTOR-like protein 3 n=1 Tax=Phragmites australis TaxID=29695 RepID=UPI002D781B59|nr:EPIDERMAL PATTERNING FACTOR-like protein 3 [Phragmites australis]
MCGARRLQKRNRAAAWFFFLFSFLLLLQITATSQGSHEQLVHVKEDSHPSPMGGGGEQREQQGLSRLGSRPPCCERKCGVCAPCEAVQVRAGAAEDRLRRQCADYEPVGWKCKCGAAVFDP